MATIKKNCVDIRCGCAAPNKNGCDLPGCGKIATLSRNKKIDRRVFLKLSGTIFVSLSIGEILQACGGGGGGGGGGSTSGNGSGSGSGSTGGTSQSPDIFNLQIETNQTTAEASWQTENPATSVVDYGLTTDYELEPVEDLSLVTDHRVTLTGLAAGTTYHCQVMSENSSGNSSSTDDLIFTTQSASGGPVIDVWYGSSQKFGHLGIPQRWVNILGNVTDSGGVDSLIYSLNGGPDQTLSLGPDSRRLASQGDFNVELDHSSLKNGNNTLVLTAMDAIGNSSTATVNISYAAGNTWPQPYTINWNTVIDIQDVAQVVDGLWSVGSGGVSPVILDYDRLIAIGDISWDDYEVTVPITVNSIDSAHGYDSPSNGPAVGIGMRWTGHVDWDGSQPRWGFWPTGAFGWYRWKTTYERFQLAGNEYQQIDEDLSGRTLTLGTTYMFKMRVETLSNGHPLYRFKVWKQGTAEPAGWDLSIEEGTEDPTGGSILLLAHHVEAVFGNVTITAV